MEDINSQSSLHVLEQGYLGINTPSVQIREINPDQAQYILDNKNNHNRLLSKARVTAYSDSMENGEWEFNGDPIRFDDRGMLLDGQHRLTALICSGVTLKFLIVGDLEPSISATIDTGKTRTSGDSLSIMRGLSGRDGGSVSGAISTLIVYESAHRLSGVAARKSGLRVSAKRSLAYYDAHKKEMDEAVKWVGDFGAARCPIILRKDQVFFMVIFSRIDKEMGETFLTQLLDGVNLDEASPITHVRNLIIQSRMRQKQLTRHTLLNTVIKGWNSYRRGAAIKHRASLIWRQGDKGAIAK